MMKPTTLTATMMVVTAVDLVWSQKNAQNANVLVKLMVWNCLVHQSVMAIAKMETTTLPATMIVMTVVEHMSIQNIVRNVLVSVCVST